MSPKAGISARDHWEQNIERFGRVYYDSSEEHLIGNRAVVSLHRRLFAQSAGHGLPSTNKIARSLLNRLRRQRTNLDVRNHSHHDPRDVEAECARHGFRIVERVGIISGWFVAAERTRPCAP